MSEKNGQSTQSKGQLPYRKNVLILVGVGYLTVCFIFGVMVSCGMGHERAYEIVNGPLMALIGGSLAIAKDLVPLGDTPTQPPQP